MEGEKKKENENRTCEGKEESRQQKQTEIDL